MKQAIQTAAVILAIAVALGAAGCGHEKKNASPTGSSSSPSSSSSSSAVGSSAASSVKSSSFSLAVCLGKSLNPLTTDSMTNLTLWPLLFDSLAEPDASYNPVMRLASSVDISGNTVTAHLRSGVKFTDGTSLTARDVLYSYNMVRNDPASYFYSNVANISGISTPDSSTVKFTLSASDALFTNLMNIPIVKYNTGSLSVSPGDTPVPVGTGRYVFSNDYLTGTLTANKSWYKGTSPAFQTIRLVNILTSSATLSSLKIGEINYLFSDDSGNGVSVVGLGTTSVNLNQMVFLGVNTVSSKPGLSNAHVRKAVSLAVDRGSIVTDVFSSRAKASSLPFNPAWAGLPKTVASAGSSSSAVSAASSAVSKTSGASKSSGASSSSSGGSDSTAASSASAASGSVNFSAAASELAAAGFPVKNPGIPGSPVLSYSLLVNQDNSLMMSAAKNIAASLAKTGIGITIDAQPSAAYGAKLSAGSFDLYLGQIRLTDNMDLSPLFSGGAAGYGASPQSSFRAAFASWQAGTAPVSSVIDAFNNETPFVPICYRMGAVSYTAGLKGTIAPTFGDIFLNEEDWHFG